MDDSDVAVKKCVATFRLKYTDGSDLFTIKVDDPAHATVTEATCVDPRFIPFLEPTAQPGTYRLRVLVTDSSTPAQATIRIATQLGERPLVSVVTVGIK